MGRAFLDIPSTRVIQRLANISLTAVLGHALVGLPLLDEFYRLRGLTKRAALLRRGRNGGEGVPWPSSRKAIVRGGDGGARDDGR